MDLEGLAATAAALLATNAGESFGTEMARQAWQRIRALFTKTERSGEDRSLVKAMVDAQAAPNDHAAISRLAEAIRARAEADPEFAGALADLTQHARHEPEAARIVVTGDAKVGKVVSMGDVHGDVAF